MINVLERTCIHSNALRIDCAAVNSSSRNGIVGKPQTNIRIDCDTFEFTRRIAFVNLGMDIENRTILSGVLAAFHFETRPIFTVSNPNRSEVCNYGGSALLSIDADLHLGIVIRINRDTAGIQLVTVEVQCKFSIIRNKHRA